MPAGPADGRVEAERRALTMPSTAPASKTRWFGAGTRSATVTLPAGNTFDAPEEILCGSRSVFFLRMWTLRRAHERHVRPAHSLRGNGDTRHDQRWRERPPLGGLGSLADHDTGVVHAIVGSPTATLPPTVTAAQSAAAIARPQQGAAIQTFARRDSSRSHQG